jgi:hypothetical protein
VTVTFNTKYPAEARNAYWQKKKSFKDKTHKATKTGLGAKLDAAEKAWNAVPWKQLDAATLKANNLLEAKTNLARAKGIKTNQLKAARIAVVAAMKEAQRVKANAALSANAQAAAKAIESKLDALMVTIDYLSLDDFNKEILRFQAAKLGAEALRGLRLEIPGGGFLGTAAKAQINPDKSVTVAGIAWEPPQGKTPPDYKGEKVTVRAERLDNSLYLNDLTLVELSGDGKKAKFK